MGTQLKKIGKYDLVDVIGREGSGVVYKATDPQLGGNIAIKILAGPKDPEALKHFNLVAQAVSKLRHPNIATLYEVGVEDGAPYLVLEFLEGESLDSLNRARSPISLDEKLSIIAQVCEAIAYAHRQNVMHENLKPSSVIVLKDGRVKVEDFGLSDSGMQKRSPAQLSESLPFMSPELLSSDKLDSRSDIFSIGVLLFQLLSGRVPFEAAEPGEMLSKIRNEGPPSLKRLLKNCPSGLDGVVQLALAKDPQQRYQTAEELGSDLTQILEKWKRERISEYLQSAETAATQRQWQKAKEYLLQVLKWDPKNPRAKVRLREAQLEFQRQEGSAGAKEMLAEAERALARSDRREAADYLNQALKLDPSNTQIVRLQDVMQESKVSAIKLPETEPSETKLSEPKPSESKRNEILQRASSARIAGDLDGARRATEEGLAANPENADLRSLQKLITQDIEKRDKQKQVQDLLSQAKAQISLGSFSSALEILGKAQTLDPSTSGIQELLSSAKAGQQQARKREDLRALIAQIEEALSKQDYSSAAAHIQEGLAKFPEAPELLKQKLAVEKHQQEEARARDIEKQLHDARQLLDRGQPDEALVLLQGAQQKYPSERSLEELLTTVRQYIEDKRIKNEKAEVMQRARDALRMSAYSDAVSLLEQARDKTGTSDFDELLEFAHAQAENSAKREKFDGVVKQARNLIEEEKYLEAKAVLQAALSDFPDPQLKTFLLDIERRMADLRSAADKALFAAERLENQGRYAEAIKFLEAQDSQYGKIPGFDETVHKIRLRQQAIQAVVTLKEQVRNALAIEDIGSARALYSQFRIPAGATDSIHTELALVRLEIQARQTEVANRKVETGLSDARLLLTRQSYDAALNLLDGIAGFVPFASTELQQTFESLQSQTKESAKPQPAPSEPLPTAQVTTDAIAPQSESPEPNQSQSPKAEISSAPDMSDERQLPEATITEEKPETSVTSSSSDEPSAETELAPAEPAEDIVNSDGNAVEPTLTSAEPSPVNSVPVDTPVVSPESASILTLSKASEIAVQIAEFEGVRSRHECIEPEHFLLGILSLEKVFEADVQNQFRLTDDGVESVRAEFEPLQAIFVAKGSNPRQARRVLRELLQKRIASRPGQALMAARPSARIQGLCVRAVNLARDMYSPQIRIVHFLISLIGEEKSFLPEFLEELHFSPAEFASAVKALQQSSKRTPVRVLNATSTAIPVVQVREVSFSKTQILEAVDPRVSRPEVPQTSDRSAGRFQLLCELPSQMEKETRLEPILQGFLTHLLAVIPGTNRGAVLIKGSNEEELLLKAYAPQGEPVVNLEAACKAMQTKEAFISRQEMDSGANPSFGMYAPLVSKDEVLGVICLDGADPDHKFESDDLKILVAIAQHACIIINKLQLQEDLKHNVALLDRLLTNFSPKVRSRLLDRVRRGRLQLGGERSEVTILFSDIRGFTNLSAGMDTEDILELLNQCFSLAADSIFKFDGTIDKFIGDAVLAVFGSPDPDPQHHANALRAAVTMQQAMIELNRQRSARRQKTFEIGIGLHCGEVLHGFVGASERMEFTVIGDAVNLASRYCSGAKAGEILISPELYQRVWQRVEASQLTVPTKHEGPLVAYKVRSLKQQVQKKYA